MCNLYSITTITEAMQRLRAEWERAMRNTPPLYAVYPDYTAPIIRETGGQRRGSLARWGLPSLKDPVTDKPNRGTTNIRHRGSMTGRAISAPSTGAWCRSTALPSRRSSRTAAAAMPGLR